MTNVEPEIIENSAAVYREEGAVEKLFDPETYDPSENGVAAIQSANAPGPTAGQAETEAASREAMEAASAEASGEASSEASGEASAEAAAGDTSEAAYQAYLKEYVDAVPAVSDEAFEEFAALIDAGDYESFPVDMCFMDTFWGYKAMTYDEFVAAGGVYEIPAFDPGLTPD